LVYKLKEKFMKEKRKLSVMLVAGVVLLLVGLLSAVAFAQDVIPEAESQATPENGMRFGGFGLRGGPGHFGYGAGNRDENLAEALGVTIEELQAAREQAFRESINDAVAEGLISQEQADRMLAMHALKQYIDRQALLAEALVMTVEDLETALGGGQTLWDLMFEKNISPNVLQANMQVAFEAAVQQAVTDGVITQAQADEILAGGGPNFFGGHGRGHHGRGGFRGGYPGLQTPDTSAPETTSSAFDA
jgi:hypothetical protein